MIEYQYISDHIENDIFKSPVEKNTLKRYLYKKYLNKIKFSKREECGLAIVMMDFPPELSQIYKFIEDYFPIVNTEYADKGDRREEMRKQNIRYTLSHNSEFKKAKIEIGSDGQKKYIKNIWTICNADSFYFYK